MLWIAFPRGFIGFMAAMLLFGLIMPLEAKDFIKGERPQQRGYSQAVITDGGKIVWLAGVLAVVDDSGKSLAGDLDGQVRQIFKLLNATLEKAGGKLSDMVQMTVFITDVRYGDRVTGNPRRQFPRQRAHHRDRLGHSRGKDRDSGLRRHRQQIAFGNENWRNETAVAPQAAAAGSSIIQAP
jgi:2-iminobutanoate/2-iminopropanoate deaminase